jgi:hypothetical protein
LKSGHFNVLPALSALRVACTRPELWDLGETIGLLKRLSQPDLRSIIDRLSQTDLFSSSLRVSIPLRRSLPECRSTFDRLSSIAMVLVSTSFYSRWLRQGAFGKLLTMSRHPVRG